jgi:hypothetical protein
VSRTWPRPKHPRSCFSTDLRYLFTKCYDYFPRQNPHLAASDSVHKRWGRSHDPPRIRKRHAPECEKDLPENSLCSLPFHAVNTGNLGNLSVPVGQERDSLVGARLVHDDRSRCSEGPTPSSAGSKRRGNRSGASISSRSVRSPQQRCARTIEFVTLAPR